MRRQLYFYTYISATPGEVGALFAGDPGRWLPPPATPRGDGWDIALDAGGTLPGRLGQHIAHVTIDPEANVLDGQVARHLEWASAEKNGWLPRLEADLELTCTSEHVCQLALLGSYRPPLSVVGGAVDSAYGHRVAEAVVRAFVLAVGSRLAATTTVTS